MSSTERRRRREANIVNPTAPRHSQVFLATSPQKRIFDHSGLNAGRDAVDKDRMNFGYITSHFGRDRLDDFPDARNRSAGGRTIRACRRPRAVRPPFQRAGLARRFPPPATPALLRRREAVGDRHLSERSRRRRPQATAMCLSPDRTAETRIHEPQFDMRLSLCLYVQSARSRVRLSASREKQIWENGNVR